MLKKTEICEIIINTTHICNLKCNYCYVDSIYIKDPILEEKNMTESTSEQLIDFLYDQSKKFKFIIIHFYGGEPLYNFKVLKKITKKTSKLMNNVSFSVTTNGTLIDNDIILFLKKYKFQVLISIDGESEIHNSMRKFKNNESTHSIVLENVKKLKSISEINLGLSAVITEKNSLWKTYSYLKTLQPQFIKAEYIRCKSDSYFELTHDSWSDYKKDLSQIADDVTSQLLQGIKPVDNRFNSKLLQLWRNKKRNEFCGAGSSILGISADGNIYPCTLLIGSEFSKIGNVTEGIDLNKLKKFKDWHTWRGKEKCSKCDIKDFCGGGCAAMWLNLNRSYCDLIKAETDLSKKIFQKIYKEKPETLALTVSEKFYIKVLSVFNG